MKTAFIRVFRCLSNLWRTVSSYACKKIRRHVTIEDVTHDGVKDIIITTDSEWVTSGKNAKLPDD